jgi:hypothetical protein
MTIMLVMESNACAMTVERFFPDRRVPACEVWVGRR